MEDVQTEIARRSCGRPTKGTGEPCKSPPHFSYGDVHRSPCRQHMTPEEGAAAQLQWQIYRHGWNEGYSAGVGTRDDYRARIAELEKRLAERKAEERAARMRLSDSYGRQLVTIDGRYGYAWSGGEPLAVGDKVRLPPNWMSPGGFIGEVTSLGSDWDGTFSEVSRKL